jgi:hypothetical protein
LAVSGQALLRGGEGVGLRRVGVDDQVQAAGQVVDDRQFLALQQQDVGGVDAARQHRAGQARLDVAHRVVAEVARQAAAEARQAGPQRDLETLLVGGDEVQRVALEGLDDLAVGDDLGAEARGTQQAACGQADEGIAPEALAPHDRLEQEAEGAAAGELQVQRERGFQVRQRLGGQRDAVVAFGGQAVEFGFGDGHVSGPSAARRATWCGRARGVMNE